MQKIFTNESGQLSFDFSASDSPYRADSPGYQGLSAVDFVVEMPKVFYFIEVKNLEDPKIPVEYIAMQKEKFLIKVDENEFQREIRSKLKDTLLKKLAAGEHITKPVIYILLLEFKDLNFQQKRKLFENIGSSIPRFLESEYSAIHSVKFDLCDKKEYDSTYNPIFTKMER
jgi:hypothetical protein